MTTLGRAERPWPARHPGGRIAPQGRARDGVVAMARRKWSELSNRQRWLIIGGGAVQVTLQAVALHDLRRRPVDDVRGPKGLWALATFINFFGPLAYLLLGRRHHART